jgi:Tfp pilus assembly protein PilO
VTKLPWNLFEQARGLLAPRWNYLLRQWSQVRPGWNDLTGLWSALRSRWNSPGLLPSLLKPQWTWAVPDRVNLFGLAVLALVTILAVTAVLGPLAGTERANADGRLNLAHERQAALADIEQVRKLKQELALGHSRLEEAYVPLLEPSRINQRIGDLTDLAVAQHLAVQQVLPGAGLAVGAHTRVPIRLLATGNYPTCSSFIRSVHQALPDVAVDSFEIKRVDVGGRGDADLRVDLVWYATAEVKAAAAADATPGQ